MQDVTTVLAQVFGLYFVIGGLAVMLREQYYMLVIGGFIKDKPLRLMWGFVELLLGLFLVAIHPFALDNAPAIVISIVCWLFVIEGTLYILMPDKTAQKMIKLFNVHAWYVGGGIFSIAVGLYLLAFAFGLL